MKKILSIILIMVAMYPAGSIFAHEEKSGHGMGKMTMHHSQKIEMEEDTGLCPVMGNNASNEYFYTYKDKTYYFCCPMCVEKFKKEPEKYISKIKNIKIEAYQFGFSPDKIEVKKGDIVRIHATSRDVPHGLYIKEYGINASLQKGKTRKIEFMADKVGEFDILCSIYCGRGHNKMKGKLIVKE